MSPSGSKKRSTPKARKRPAATMSPRQKASVMKKLKALVPEEAPRVALKKHILELAKKAPKSPPVGGRRSVAPRQKRGNR